jgi:cytochrome o ubiquinol oxidase subunit IV
VERQLDAQGRAPGVNLHSGRPRVSYLVGLVYAVALTLASFWASSSTSVYAPAVPVLLAVLAVAQMGVHLVFFLHISSAPDETNNVLALAFGVFVTAFIVFGSLLIMAHLNHAMMSMEQLQQMQR